MCDVCGCSRKIKIPTALKGDTGIGIDSIESTGVGNNTVITITMTDGAVYTVNIEIPSDGQDSNSIDHISFTSTTAISGLAGEFGETDTYTFWGDEAETVNLGTFTITNGAAGIGEVNNGESLATVAAIDIYQGMSGPDLTFLGIDVGAGLSISEDGADILIELGPLTGKLVDPSGTTPGANPLYVTSPVPFTAVNNFPSHHVVKFMADTVTNSVQLKGTVQLSGSTFGINPLVSPTLIAVRIITNLPAEFIPSVDTFFGASLLNIAAKYVGHAVVRVTTSGDMLLYFDSRFNYVDNTTIISFEGSRYSLS